ncbi:complement C1q-like protein 4 [Saccostrea echinata]|uniref:complement C1q-like protein 4 n=1 Tax=Saccostrea echinata TaxID=191078 RepID=UPI002A810543|nr:complement C1q-like protein 4 [Saccostrea echinata]
MERRLMKNEKILLDLTISCNAEHRKSTINRQQDDKKTMPSSNKTSTNAVTEFPSQNGSPNASYQGRLSIKNEAQDLFPKRQMSGVVAFYVYLSSTEPSPSVHHTIIFDYVKTNTGEAYNRHSGMFTAPTDGVYVFTWSTYSDHHGVIYTEIVVNSDVIGSALSDSINVNAVDAATGNIVVEISQNDVVFIRTNSIHHGTGDILSYPRYRTSFSGWKLV